MTFARAASSATSFFYLDSDGSTESTIYRVERTTGQLTALGSLQAPSYALAAASDQVLYVVTTAGALLEVAVEPFTVTQVGSVGLTGVTGLAFANGELVATDEDTRSLYRIQLAPLATTLVGPLLLDGSPLNIGGGDIAVDAAGTWYLWSNGTLALYQLDVTTGAVTLLPAPSPPPGTISGLAVDFDDGALLASSAQPQSLNALITLDPTGKRPISIQPLCVSCPTPFQMHYGDLATTPPPSTSGPPPSTSGTTSGTCTDDESCNVSCNVIGQCVAGHCTTMPRPAVDQVLCGLDALSPTDVCAGQPIDAGLTQLVETSVSKSRTLILDAKRVRLSSRPKSMRRFVKAADRQLAIVSKRARRLAKKANSPSAGCAHLFDGRVSALRQLLGQVVP